MSRLTGFSCGHMSREKNGCQEKITDIKEENELQERRTAAKKEITNVKEEEPASGGK